MAGKRVLPSLISLRTFEAAARLRSFRLAAMELGVTESAVSHQIARLEQSMEARLFVRRPSGVELTTAGTLYYPFLREAFDQIEHGTALVRRDRTGHDITLQVYVTVAVRWLIPKLHRFRAAHPGVRIALDASITDWDFDPNSADIGIIYTDNPFREGIDYQHLFDSPLLLVCSPSLRTFINRPDDISAFALLEVFMAPNDWQTWRAAAGCHDVQFDVVEKFDSYILAIEAALGGQGVMVVPEFMISADLTSGRVVEPLPFRARQEGAWYVASPKRKRNDPGIAVFRSWLMLEAGHLQRRSSGGTESPTAG